MKSIVTALLVLSFIHLLVLAGGLLWLKGSGRLNAERLRKTVDLYRLTLSQEQKKQEEQERQQAEQEAQAAQIARLEEVAMGPTTVSKRLNTHHEGRELAMNKIQRLQREIKDMSRYLDFAKRQLTRQKNELDQERARFKKLQDTFSKQRRDKNFQRVVEMYASLKPKQAKQMFLQMISHKMVEKVVDYLAAMPLRKASAIVGQFKKDDEIATAGMLMDRLAQRGVAMLSPVGTKAMARKSAK